MQHHIPYNNCLKELQTIVETAKEDVAKDVAYKEKLAEQKKPYAFMDIRINRQNYLLDTVETFVENSYNLITELQQKLQEKNNIKLVEQYTHQDTEQRHRICDMPQDRQGEIIGLLVDILDKVEDLPTKQELISKYTLTPKKTN